MFKHLLVPVDGSDLSVINVGEAVKLARSFDPPLRLTFFHALADYAASDSGLRVQGLQQDRLQRAPVFAEGLSVAAAVLNDEEFHQRELGESRALLAKACAAAAAAQVPHDTHSAVSDHAAEAIVKAAADCGCDGIVMASHGRSGLGALLTPSVATKVMRLARLPLLITRSMANDTQVEASRATALILDEHRSLAAVLQGLRRRIDDARSGAERLDRGVVGALLRYIHDYPEQRHHPKEESSLHRLLRQRGDRGRDLLHQLEAQHLHEYQLAAELQLACDACPDRASGDDPALLRLDAAAAALASHVWQHMRLEEHELLPLALEVLTPGDWREVADVFTGNQDPGFGEWSEADFRRHFTQAANSAPLPQAQTRP
jgi:nucleotide-binding universal stress UspA family protein/hemerythrin-like domain-containing protein